MRASSYLAIDLGAESGRVMLGQFADGALRIEEMHRFANEPVRVPGSLRWDVLRLWMEIGRGLKACQGMKLDGIGVDTWGVDYALLGEDGQLLENPYHYRDERTDGMMERAFQLAGDDAIYGETGIQFMQINTLYQLFAAQLKTPHLLAAAHRLITMPDLFHYWLTGNAVCEFTNASTTQMVNPYTRQWSKRLLNILGLPTELPGPIVEPGTKVGEVLKSVSADLAGTPVIAPATHDTGSAVAAVHGREDTAFISSGTWSLVGIESDAPVVTVETMKLNFTNEGGVCGTTRLLKNVMGLWMLQGCRKRWAECGEAYDYSELMTAARKETAFQHLVNPDHPRFLHPDCMLTAIDDFCTETGQPKPSNVGAYVRTVLESLAMKYRRVILDLERLLNRPIRQIRVIGGGSKNDLLNQLTADATGKRILAGPVEATALGNIAMQLVGTGAVPSLAESRALIGRAYPPKIFEPRGSADWDAQASRFEQYAGI